MNYRIILFIVLSPSIIWGQKLRPEIQTLIDSIAEYGQIDDPYIGYAGIRSVQYDRSERLKISANTQELSVLINHSNPAVKCIAFNALCFQDSIDILSILFKGIYDTKWINYQSGCIGSSIMVGDLFLQTFYLNLVNKDSTFFASNYLSLLKIDSILFYDPEIKLEYKTSKVRSINADPKYYDRVREIADKERLPIAVVTLAKYHNNEDKKIITSYFDNDKTEYYAIWAAREFPDSSFYPLLIKVFNKEWKQKYYDYSKWRILFQALAKYPNEQTIALFDKTVGAVNTFRRETLSRYLLIAITKYPNPIFEKYKEQIHVDGFHAEYLDQETDIEK